MLSSPSAESKQRLARASGPNRLGGIEASAIARSPMAQAALQRRMRWRVGEPDYPEDPHRRGSRTAPPVAGSRRMIDFIR
jgi:hypothetical protein